MEGEKDVELSFFKNLKDEEGGKAQRKTSFCVRKHSKQKQENRIESILERILSKIFPIQQET